MELLQAYQIFIAQLQPLYSAAEAKIITRNIFESILNISASEMKHNGNKNVEDENSEKLKIALQKILSGMPYAYVQERAWFYNLTFKVTDAVLIPRPETEELVEKLLKTAKGTEKILDIGTGSGCIPITIKLKIPRANVTALEVSESALQIARENAATHHTEIDFKLLDFLDENKWKDMSTFDFIISNPPYIAERNKLEIEKQVTDFEPALALFVPDDEPLIFYKKIHAFAINHLNKNGKIYLETHHDNAKEVAGIFTENYTTEIIEDMSGKERFVIATQYQ